MSSDDLNAQIIGPALAGQLERMQTQCIECPKCSAQCAFLEAYGSPKQIAAAYDPTDITHLTLPFLCSLCDLCTAVCPMELTPGKMFLEMRREAVARGAAPLGEHKGIMAYENRGVSARYSWYSLPKDCTCVFFPGCTFSGTRMDTTIALYAHLRAKIPNMGIVLDCCTKPSHDLGRSDYFDAMFGEMKTWLMDQGINEIMVVCPNCHKVFKTYGTPLKVTSVYEFLVEKGLPSGDLKTCGISGDFKTTTIHDPCVLRHEPAIQQAVRKLAATGPFTMTEMPHSKAETLCCGEGGTVGAVSPKFSEAWSDLRKAETGSRRLLTYCAGCAGMLNRKIPTDHILDAVFFPEAVVAGKRKTTPPPFTYLNRLRLKRHLQKKYPAQVTRERNFKPPPAVSGAKTGKWLKFLVLAIMAGGIAGIHFSGLLQRFDAETLRQTVAAYGFSAPVIYMLIYAVAPALFLPGLPITLAGGILFGPLWGVVYSITGATAGACVAFLIARYVAGDWARAKLTSPRWRKLNQNVEKNGWKIVAFTRLVPLFPFNLLNYAFGLTPIKFWPYAVTSFFSMLPACIAFIVFSSSLVDLVKGRVSIELIVGIILIVAVSLMPMAIKKIRRRQFGELE